MLERRVKIVNRLGLHARAAAKLVKIAEEFQSEIIVTNEKNHNSVDAKSILCLLTLCASQGSELKIETNGIDEKEALERVERIFVEGFGEDN
ncbi:MAG: HPr family phosphocarrier protein [Pyrinomonadaceae bacterium]|nr:HPr family phosphocarrier protein [Pyrinomonadaceae bacterium]